MIERGELLTILIEEAAEVIQAATKCQRFGYDWDEPGYGINSERLAGEVGDFLGIMDVLGLSREIIEEARSSKIDRVLHFKNKRARADRCIHCGQKASQHSPEPHLGMCMTPTGDTYYETR